MSASTTTCAQSCSAQLRALDRSPSACNARLPSYAHHTFDIRDCGALESLFAHYGADVSLVVHAAAQPSHDFAARDPDLDFTVNADATRNILKATSRFAPDAVFIFVSTNKVYGEHPNALPFIDRDTRWDVAPDHKYVNGIDETMSIDQSARSLFGVSKTAADLYVQEYGFCFDLQTACFRCGCLSGPQHAGAELHGFLSYLMRCTLTEQPYTVFGHQGKQVRDNLHSHDLVRAFDAFFRRAPSVEPSSTWVADGPATARCWKPSNLANRFATAN